MKCCATPELEQGQLSTRCRSCGQVWVKDLYRDRLGRLQERQLMIQGTTYTDEREQ